MAHLPITLIIRFAISVPDLRLNIESPDTSNTATLCTLIRPHLPTQYSTCALRLIYAGAFLPKSTSLSTSLRLTSSQGGNIGVYSQAWQTDLQQQQQQLYIHCSIASDTYLIPAELEDEAQVAKQLLESRTARAKSQGAKRGQHVRGPRLPGKEADDAENDDDIKEVNVEYGRTTSSATNAHTSANASSTSHYPQTPDGDTNNNITTTDPQPQGFDRLLSAGLTPAEVASLRTQFLAIQSHIHTPDTMPTTSELRRMEERWLDSGANGPSSGGSGSGIGGGGGLAGEDGAGGGNVGDDDDDAIGGSGSGGLEDMLWGNLMGFFWAVGAVVWLVREEGVWSRRRQVGVVTGVLVNLAFCFLRVGS